MKTTTSTIVNKVIADSKKLTSSPIERRMIQNLLIFGFVRTAEAKGFSTDDRTSKILSICEKLGLKVHVGNDAPKGGKIGNFIERSSDDVLLKQLRSVFKRKAAIEKAKEQRISSEAAKRCSEQKISLVEYFKGNSDFYELIKNRIENFPSKQWRNWVRMKCASVLVGNFSEFELSAVEVREAVYNV